MMLYIIKMNNIYFIQVYTGLYRFIQVYTGYTGYTGLYGLYTYWIIIKERR